MPGKTWKNPSRAAWKAVTWIAMNDEAGETDPLVVADAISVCLVADVWNRRPIEVAELVLRVRARMSTGAAR